MPLRIPLPKGLISLCRQPLNSTSCAATGNRATFTNTPTPHQQQPPSSSSGSGNSNDNSNAEGTPLPLNIPPSGGPSRLASVLQDSIAEYSDTTGATRATNTNGNGNWNGNRNGGGNYGSTQKWRRGQQGQGGEYYGGYSQQQNQYQQPQQPQGQNYNNYNNYNNYPRQPQQYPSGGAGGGGGGGGGGYAPQPYPSTSALGRYGTSMGMGTTLGGGYGSNSGFGAGNNGVGILGNHNPTANNTTASENNPLTDADTDDLFRAQRRFRSGEMYTPKDLSFESYKQWRKRRAPTKDAFDVLGLDPLKEYKNFNLLSEYTTDMGRIKHRTETGLRPVNQRRIAKAIRRAVGIGLLPSTHKHPELLKKMEETFYGKLRLAARGGYRGG